MSGHSQPPGYPSPAERRLQSADPLLALSGLAQIKEVSEGFLGTADIVAEMKQYALSSYPDERINQLARRVTIDCPPHDHECEAATLLMWFQTQFRYTKLPFHPKGFQRLQTPSYTLFDAPVRTGECASLSTALVAMLMSLGFKCAYRTAGQNADNPQDFEHVYVVIEIPGVGWMTADPSYQYGLGWEHPATQVRMDWPVV